MFRKDTWYWWLPSAGWALLIFWLSSRSSYGKPSWWFEHADKVIHGGLFFGLALCLLIGFRRGACWSMPAAAIGSFLLAAGYGALDEFHQFFVPNRVTDVADFIADAVGAAIAVILCWMLSFWLGRRNRKTA